MNKEAVVLSMVMQILKDADRDIHKVLEREYPNDELDQTEWAVQAYSLAWDAMREAEELYKEALKA